MEDNIGFKDIERKTEKLPDYVKSTLWLVLVSFVFCIGLIYAFVAVNNGNKNRESSRHILDDCQEKTLLMTRSPDERSYINLGDFATNKITVINNIAAKKLYAVINIRGEADITDYEDDGISVEAGYGLSACKLYESRDKIVVELTYDNYYDLSYEKDATGIVINENAKNQEQVLVVIRTDDELCSICQKLSSELEKKGVETYLIGNEVEPVSEDDYLAFVDSIKADYYICFETANRGTGELELTSYCNSRYFIPGENSITFSDRLVGNIAKDASIKVTGVESCKEEDIVGEMTIPASHIVFTYGKDGQIDSINNGEKKAALIGAVIDALTYERKDK